LNIDAYNFEKFALKFCMVEKEESGNTPGVHSFLFFLSFFPKPETSTPR
jgi:hypothetical protein